MAVLTLQGTGVTDTALDSSVPDTDLSGGNYLYIGRYDTAWYGRSILKFDISSIPAGSTINSATLSFWVAIDYSNNNRDIGLYRILRTVVIEQATWNSYSTGNSWATAGCDNTTSDREAGAISTKGITSTEAVDSEIQMILNVALVEEKVSSGVLTLLLRNTSTESDDNYYLYSTNYATVGKRPKLVIDYTPGVSAGGSFLLNFV